MIVSTQTKVRNSLMFTRTTALRLGIPVFVVLLAGCASFAPCLFKQQCSERNRHQPWLCVHEPSLDPKRINGSKTIQLTFGEAGFDSSCGAQAYVVEWWFESTDSGSTTPICRHFARVWILALMHHWPGRHADHLSANIPAGGS